MQASDPPRTGAQPRQQLNADLQTAPTCGRSSRAGRTSVAAAHRHRKQVTVAHVWPALPQPTVPAMRTDCNTRFSGAGQEHLPRPQLRRVPIFRLQVREPGALDPPDDSEFAGFVRSQVLKGIANDTNRNPAFPKHYVSRATSRRWAGACRVGRRRCC